MIEVRQIRSGEWERLRDIRLEALADTPSAFATTFAEAEAYPDSVWQERAIAGAAGRDQITVLAVSGERPIGLTVALGRPGLDLSIVPIVSVFVASSERRQGIAVRLLDIAEEWARNHGASRSSLWVEEQNAVARSAYASTGYTETPDRQQIPASAETWEIRLEKVLKAPG
jgi:GNAT superfamily N-acetyltransferase